MVTAEPAEPLVRTRDLGKSYRVGETCVTALSHLNLEISRGGFTAVSGASGAGKSTLLNMLAGLEKPTAGEIWINGRPVHRFNEDQLATHRREQVGLLFRFSNLLPSLTVTQNVALPLSLLGQPRARRDAKARELLTALGLEDHLDHRPSRLSGDQRQRVAIARAMVTGPELVLADEPTGNLDSSTAERTLLLFRRLIHQSGQTWLMATHDPHLAGFADTVVSISDGRITDITHLEHDDLREPA